MVPKTSLMHFTIHAEILEFFFKFAEKKYQMYNCIRQVVKTVYYFALKITHIL